MLPVYAGQLRSADPGSCCGTARVVPRQESQTELPLPHGPGDAPGAPREQLRLPPILCSQPLGMAANKREPTCILA